MKKFLQALRGKSLTVIENCICLTLVLVMCVLSFGTIFTVSFDLDDETRANINEVLTEVAGSSEEPIVIKEKIDVNFAFLLKSAKLIPDIVESASSTLDSVANGEAPTTDPNDTSKISQDLVDFVVFLFAILASINSFWLVGVCNLLLLSLVITLPLIVLFSAFFALLGFLFNLKNPGKASHKISKAFHRILNIFPLLLLILVFLPDVKFGGAVYGILALCLVGIGIGLLVSRIKPYDGDDFKYINLLQATSALSLVGYVLFFVNIVKSKLFNSVFAAVSGRAVTELASSVATGSGEVDTVPLVMAVVLVYAAYSVIKSMTRLVTRFACMSKSKSPTHVFKALLGLLVAVIPIVMMSGDINLTLTSAQKGNFAAMIVGLVLMLAAEIALYVLPNKLCPNCTAERRREIVTGSYVHESQLQSAPAAESDTI